MPSRNIGINLKKFSYQMTEWFDDWFDMIPFIVTKDPEIPKDYGVTYVIKQDSNKKNCQWAIFTTGSYIKESEEVYRKLFQKSYKKEEGYGTSIDNAGDKGLIGQGIKDAVAVRGAVDEL